MAWAHSTSSEISTAQLASAVGMVVPPVWLTLVNVGPARPNLASNALRSEAMLGCAPGEPTSPKTVESCQHVPGVKGDGRARVVRAHGATGVRGPTIHRAKGASSRSLSWRESERILNPQTPCCQEKLATDEH